MSVPETARNDRRPARRGAGGASPATAATAPALLALFLVALILPVFFDAGGLRLSPYRIFLLVFFVPMLIRVLSGKAGGVRKADICFLLFGVWMMISMIVNHGAEQLEFAGITVVEIVGGYLFGRCVIRNDTDYRLFFRYFLFCLIFMLPFVLLEQVTQKPLLNQMLKIVFEVHRDYSGEKRLGLNRVQGFFEHPILYGLFCSVGIANFYYLSGSGLRRAFSTGFAVFMTAMSVSTAPLLSIVLQLGMIGWDIITKAKWLLLTGLVGAAYVVIDLLSNRSPFHVLVTYATLNQGSAYNRILIWRFGSQNVAANPVFGIGMNDWVRPFWMVPSVDNFWLLMAMRYGIPAIAVLSLGIALSIWGLTRRKGLTPGEDACRTGYMVALTALIVGLGTVHVWAATSVMVAFYLGAGAWLSEAGRPWKDPKNTETGIQAKGSAVGARREAARAPRKVPTKEHLRRERPALRRRP